MPTIDFTIHLQKWNEKEVHFQQAAGTKESKFSPSTATW